MSEGYPTPYAAGEVSQDPAAVAAAAALATSLTTLGYAMFALMVPGPLENIQPITTAEDHLRSQPTQQPVAVVEPEPEPVVMVEPEPEPVEYVVNDPIPLPVQMDVAPEPIVAAAAPANEAVAPTPLPVAPLPVTPLPVSAAVANQFGEVDTVAPEPLPVVPEPLPVAAEPAAPAPGRVNKSTLTMLQEISFLDE